MKANFKSVLLFFGTFCLLKTAPAMISNYNVTTFEKLLHCSKDSIVIQKSKSARKHKINLYPDANHEVLFFTASGRAKYHYQLFLFDMEGKLIKHVSIKEHQVTLIKNMEKGNYQFEVFSNDERLESGQILIR